MERRDFLAILSSIPLIGSAIAEKCSPAKPEEVKNAPTKTIENLNNVDEEVKIIIPKKPKVTKIAPQKNLNENRYYTPRWNVSGSWGKAESRPALISHLSGPNHRYSSSYLNTLSIDELQKLHDDDHNRRIRRWK